MKKEYNEVDILNYVNHLSTYGNMNVIHAEKIERVIAAQDENNKDNYVLTIVDKNNKKILDDRGNFTSYYLNKEDLELLYDHVEDNIYTSVPVTFKFVEVQHDIRFVPNLFTDNKPTFKISGIFQQANKGDYLNISNEDDIYAISKKEFNDYYYILEDKEKSKSK